MDMKRHSIALAACMAAVVVLASASSWEGSAMMGSYGDFPASGYYAACNSFPRSTSVEVVNLENGRSITAIVTGGLESSGVFMMLSVEAANALGLKQGRVARVRASEPRSAVELAPSSSASSSYDPDINPRLMAAEELRRLGYDLGPTDSTAVARAPAPPATPVAPPVVTAPPATPVAPPVAAKPAVEPAKPSAIGLAAPPSPASASVAEPTPVGKETPVPMASVKPKPVRTIILPQLPEPSRPAEPTVAAVAEPSPDAVSLLLPQPDETPIRVAPSSAPKRYEAPAVRPDVSTGGPKAPSGGAHTVVLAEPVPVSDDRAAALARTAPELYAGSATAELYDPSAPSSEGATALSRVAPAYAAYEGEYGLSDPAAPASERADAIARLAPARTPSGQIAELVWPEIEADEIPEIVLAGLNAPVYEIPATSLAEGEIILPAKVGPSALALETPAYGAAETTVALEDAETQPTVETASGIEPYVGDGDFALAEAEAKGVEKPVADVKASASPIDSGSGAALAEAAEQKPETAPYVEGPAEKPAPVVALESPREYIVAIEPTGPKPPEAPVGKPVAPAAPPAVKVAPVAPAPAVAAPVVTAPAVTGPVVTGPLAKGLYYIQIGAFGSESVAKDAAGGIGKKYAVLIQKTSDKGKDTWRVFVGPLSRDESGVALVRVRAMGYKDAFLKSGS